MTDLGVLCEIAQCPLTGTPLVPLDAEALDELNSRVAEGALHHSGGGLVAERLSEALASRDGGVVYRVDDGIAGLLPQLAIIRTTGLAAVAALDSRKEVVREYYETFGWERKGDDYLDTITFVDRRPLSMRYLDRCHRRVREQLSDGGRFMLDAASGPVQYPEYRRLSEEFEFRVCLDFSTRALVEARRNLGAHGLYVLGDVTQLPFRDSAFDAAVSLHTIYHLPAAEQPRAFEELHRVVRAGGRVLVVYQWGPGRVRRAGLRAARLAPISWRKAGPARQESAAPPLYAHANTYRWFARQRWPFQTDVRVWRLVGSRFLTRYVHERFLGRLVLRALNLFEESAPHLAGRHGRYPLIVIQKRDADSVRRRP